jgi:hypothetical protein
MLIGKVSSERKKVSWKDNRDHKHLLTEILSRLSNLEASAKQLAEDQRNQTEKMERMVGQFHLYLRYVHHMDITPADQSGTPACIRKTCTVVQRKRMRKERMEAKNISSSWTSVGSSIGQVVLLSIGTTSFYDCVFYVYSFVYLFKLDIGGLGQFPVVAAQPYPLLS